jgi:hypothetical protein
MIDCEKITDLEHRIEDQLKHNNLIYLNDEIGEDILYVVGYKLNDSTWLKTGALVFDQIISLKNQIKCMTVLSCSSCISKGLFSE